MSKSGLPVCFFEICYALRSKLSRTIHRRIARIEYPSSGEFCSTGQNEGKSYALRSLLIRGILLCANKDETIVQYSVLKGSEQLFASKYRTVLPTEAELTAELERERRVIDQQREGGEV